MTQQVLKAVVSLVNGDTLADDATNTFIFEATGSNTSLTVADLNSYLSGFYNDTAFNSLTNPLSHYLAAGLTRATNGITIEYFDVTAHLDGSPAGAAIASGSFTLGAAGVAQDLPPEVAYVMSFRATYGTDPEHGSSTTLPSSDSAIDQGAPTTHTGVPRPRARDRSRIYLGPFNGGVLASSNGVPNSTFLSDMFLLAQSALCTQKPGDSDQFNLVAWSRRSASVKQLTYYGNAEGFCTQRRRGDTALNRVHTWSVSNDNPIVAP